MTVATRPVWSNTLIVSIQPAFGFICQHIDNRLVYTPVTPEKHLNCEVLICSYIKLNFVVHRQTFTDQFIHF